MPRITDEQRARVIELHGQGLSRNAIHRETGISTGSVTRICTTAGRAFDRASTKDATRARAADMAQARMDLTWRLADAANGMLDMLGKPFTVFNFGGKDNTFNSAELDQPPVDAQRTIITAAAIVHDKMSRIVEKQSTGTESALGLLDHAAAAFAAAADVLRDEDSTDAGSE